MTSPAMHCLQSDLDFECQDNYDFDMQKPRWTASELDCLKKEYKQKETDWPLVFNKIKHSKEAIIQKAGRLGLSEKQKNWKPILENLKEEFQHTKVKDLAKKYNVPTGSLLQLFHRYNIKKKIHWHKYFINPYFFSQWTRESAYVLGLIASDGCVNSRPDRYSVEISSKDEMLLENVNKLMNFTKPVEKSRTTYRIRIDNPIIYKDILDKGITPKKSKTIQFPAVPVEFQNHFIRGFFDGDGSIFKLNEKRGRVVAKFTCWSPPFLEKLQEILSQACNVRPKKIHDNSIVYYPIESFKVFEYLYKDSTANTRLDRKYNRYMAYGRGVEKCVA